MAFSIRKSKKEEKTDEKQLTRAQKIFRDCKDYVYVFCVFMALFAVLFRMVEVDGTSMNRTLYDGDRLLLVSRALYRTAQQGDVVVISKDSFKNGENIIKRVIATEGQTVDLDYTNRTVYVDGVALSESYVFFAEGDDRPLIDEGMTFPLTVEQGCVFVMGDNRNNSKDSRSTQIGLIDEREILGKAIFLLFPGTNEGEFVLDFSRIGVVH